MRVAAGQVVLMDPDRSASSTEEDALESGQKWLGFFDTSPMCTLVCQLCGVVCALSLYSVFSLKQQGDIGIEGEIECL